MSKYFVITVYGPNDSTVLGAMSGRTIAECEQSIRWQGQGGFDVSMYHVCTPAPKERGTFIDIKTGERFATNRGAFTDLAYGQLLDEVWGA